VATSAKCCGGKDGTNEQQTLISTQLGRLGKSGGIVVAGGFHFLLPLPEVGI
jgi:hypothetical protein